MDDDFFAVTSLTVFRFFFSLSTLVSVQCVLQSHVALLFQCGAVILLLFNFFFLWRSPKFTVGYIAHVDKLEWELVGGERKIKVTLCPTSVVTRYLLILHFVDENNRGHVAILVGGIFESYCQRRLRFILRTQSYEMRAS